MYVVSTNNFVFKWHFNPLVPAVQINIRIIISICSGSKRLNGVFLIVLSGFI